MMKTQDDQIRAAARSLARAKKVAVLTGAGISAESGVPTFRGPDGLWHGRRPEDVATPEAFDKDPDDVWRFYLSRRMGLASVKPNPGHHALTDLARIITDLTVITQNVDGLHHAAGNPDIITLHGDVMIDRCTQCGHESRACGDDFETIPTCIECGGLARPGVVWFRELLDPADVTRAHLICSECQVMLVVGTSSLVTPAADLPVWAKTCGATLIEINLNETPLSHLADHRLRGPSGELIPKLVYCLKMNA
jgi:NAD-dependent deacetylase